MSLDYNTDDSILGPAGFIFQTPVRAKKHKPSAAKAPGALDAGRQLRRLKAARRLAKASVAAVVARKAPEVMVKVSGSVRGRYHLREHLSYISRNGQLLMEKDDGELVSSSEDVRDLADEWWARRAGKRPGHGGRETVNIVLSMPVGTDSAALHDAVRDFAKITFGANYDYVMVLHTPETDPSKNRKDHPHVHLTVRSLGRDGQCLNPTKEDLQAWREGFAHRLRARGVSAAATPRRARGVVQKGESHVVRSIAESEKAGRDRTRGARRSKVNAWRVQQAIKTLQPGAPAPVEPWRAASNQKQHKIRRAWGSLAFALEADGDLALAAQVREYVAQMPEVGRFKQDEVVAKAKESLELLRKSQEALAPTIEQTPRPPPRRR